MKMITSFVKCEKCDMFIYPTDLIISGNETLCPLCGNPVDFPNGIVDIGG